MKRILCLCVFFSLHYLSSGQLNGDGSSGNPFWGSITSTVQWSTGNPVYGSTVYVGTSSNNDLTVGTGGHLIIDPGITVVFTQLTTDLFITGSGQLTAGGSGTEVLFTKDPGKSHWGHMSFQNMSGTPASSTIDNCIFEYGYSTGTSAQPLLAGGALQVDFNNVVISNCLFRNNYANYAGAVMIGATRNTVIRNSSFESNDVYECGGAMIIYTNSTALVENCLFFDNYSRGYSSSSYSGGAIWSYSNSSKVINCTFVENNSDRAGDALYSYNASGMRIINSIFWGSNDQFAGSSTTSTIVNCAFESAKPANAVTSIIISDVAADHFTDAGSGDWSLKFISPCRDAGVNTYTGVTIPSTDYAGNPTIHYKDIGAYEVQYSRWTGSTSTSWETASNWAQNVDPVSGTGDVIIPAGLATYPVDASNPAFTIATGDQMILEPGSQVTLSSITNNGTLRLRSNATAMSSLIINSYSGNDADVELYLSGGGETSTYKWHYISSPMTSLPVSTFTGVTLDVVGYAEPRVTTDLVQGWVAWDGYVYATGTFDNTYAFSSLTPGKGYDYWDQLNNTFTLSGSLNTANIPVSLSYNGTANSGFNLLGNPFTSGLNWDLIIGDAGYPASTSKGLYFTRNNVQCSYVGGVGIPGDVTGIIPPMQGFFVKTSSAGNSITLPLSARTHSNIHSYYKGSGTIPLVRLQLSKDTLSDETVIRFDEMAKSELDNDFDALKVFSSPDAIGIYSTLGNTRFAINGIPFPDETVEIPVAVNIPSDGTYKINAIQLQGLSGHLVELIDLSTGSTTRLNSSPAVTFTASKGLVADRFVLKVSNLITGIEDPVKPLKSFNIYQANGKISVQLLADDWDGKIGFVRIFDLSGKALTEFKNQEFRKNSIIEIMQPSVTGLYIIELRSGLRRHIEKVVIK